MIYVESTNSTNVELLNRWTAVNDGLMSQKQGTLGLQANIIYIYIIIIESIIALCKFHPKTIKNPKWSQQISCKASYLTGRFFQKHTAGVKICNPGAGGNPIWPGTQDILIPMKEYYLFSWETYYPLFGKMISSTRSGWNLLASHWWAPSNLFDMGQKTIGGKSKMKKGCKNQCTSTLISLLSAATRCEPYVPIPTTDLLWKSSNAQ
jgi:hypothetical protein